MIVAKSIQDMYVTSWDYIKMICQAVFSFNSEFKNKIIQVYFESRHWFSHYPIFSIISVNYTGSIQIEDIREDMGAEIDVDVAMMVKNIEDVNYGLYDIRFKAIGDSKIPANESKNPVIKSLRETGNEFVENNKPYSK